MSRLISTLGAAFVGLAAACAGINSVPPGVAAHAESPVAAATPAAPGAYEAVVVVPVPLVVTEPPRSELRQEPVVAPALPVTSANAPKVVPPPARSPAMAAAPPVAVEQPRRNADPVAVAKAPEPALDVAGLTARLRDTMGIGVLTKLTLKNQVDDLLKRFRTHYQSGQKTGVASLRQPYDMLVLKVLALLQDSDPALARTISGSREAIWGILADREKFNAIA